MSDERLVGLTPATQIRNPKNETILNVRNWKKLEEKKKQLPLLFASIFLVSSFFASIVSTFGFRASYLYTQKRGC